MKYLILFSFTIVCAKIRCVRNPDARKKDARNLNFRENHINAVMWFVLPDS